MLCPSQVTGYALIGSALQQLVDSACNFAVLLATKAMPAMPIKMETLYVG